MLYIIIYIILAIINIILIFIGFDKRQGRYDITQRSEIGEFYVLGIILAPIVFFMFMYVILTELFDRAHSYLKGDVWWSPWYKKK